MDMIFGSVKVESGAEEENYWRGEKQMFLVAVRDGTRRVYADTTACTIGIPIVQAVVSA